MTASCGAPTIQVQIPPASAAPAVVLDAYLRALRSGECKTGRVLTTATFSKGSGELCGEARVDGFRIMGEPATPISDEVVFATTLTTGGSTVGSVPAGDITWFYTLDRQPDGAWRISSGGSGP